MGKVYPYYIWVLNFKLEERMPPCYFIFYN